MDQRELRELEYRCVQEEAPPCTARCPIHVDVKGLLRETAAGRWDQALHILARSMPFPGMVARICDQPCREVCNLAEGGDAIAIRELERAVVERGVISKRPAPQPRKDQRLAIVGSGLSSLAAALELRRKGYEIILFEAGNRLAEPLRGSLPDSVIEAEVGILGTLGVTISLNQEIEGDGWLKTLTTEFDAVYVGRDSGIEPLLLTTLPVDPLTLKTSWAGLFVGGGFQPDGRSSPISAVADGRTGAISIDRFLQKVSLTAGREQEGPYETRLSTNLTRIAPRYTVSPQNPGEGYSDDEARAEAARCLQCECMECVKQCLFMQQFKAYPKRYARQISNDATMVLGSHGPTRKLVNSCSLCDLCTVLCPHDFPMAEVCMEGRRSLVEKGKMPPSAHDFALEDMASANSPRSALAFHEPGKDVSRFVFFPGCQLSGMHPDHVSSVYAHLRSRLTGGTGLMVRCCGVPAKWAAQDDLFRQAIGEVEKDWDSLGRPVMIVACPTCYRTFQEHLPGVEVVSLWEMLVDIGPASDQRRFDQTLAVHDPCTARHETSMQDAVRFLLARLGCTIEELPLARTTTECCGYGGLVSTANPPLARETAQRRAGLSDADYVTYCAMCRNALAAAGKRVTHVLDWLFPAPGPVFPSLRPCGLSERRENRYRLREKLVRTLWKRGNQTVEPYETIVLHIGDEVWERMEERRILREDIQRVICRAMETNGGLMDSRSGHSLASFKPAHVTYWVEYSSEGDGFRIHNAYSHRMEIMGNTGG